MIRLLANYPRTALKAPLKPLLVGLLVAYCPSLLANPAVPPPTSLSHARYSVEAQLPKGEMVTQSAADLCTVAQSTLRYLNRGQSFDPEVIHSGISGQFGVDLSQVKQTLEFICQVQQQDQANPGVNRLADVGFLNQHFQGLRWLPDKAQAQSFAKQKPLLQNLPADQILLTKYYVKLAQGSPVKTAETPYALYALPHDEQGLTLVQAEQNKANLIRFRYTKQQILTGILDQHQWATPLFWLSREDLEDSLMQGTVRVNSQGTSAYFNVHRNNAIGYDRALKKYDQKRYWYFRQTQGVLGYGKDIDDKIPIIPMVTVAGDVKQLGLGKLILLTVNNQHRLAILADTGGAFDQNLYQLDYLGGFFNHWQDYINTYRHFPDYFEARILSLNPQSMTTLKATGI